MAKRNSRGHALFHVEVFPISHKFVQKQVNWDVKLICLSHLREF